MENIGIGYEEIKKIMQENGIKDGEIITSEVFYKAVAKVLEENNKSIENYIEKYVKDAAKDIVESGFKKSGMKMF